MRKSECGMRNLTFGIRYFRIRDIPHSSALTPDFAWQNELVPQTK